MWNLTGFHVINVLGKGCKFSATHYITEMSSPLPKWRRSLAEPSDRKLTLDADNAQPHTSRMPLTFLDENDMTRAPHPFSSPDLAPSDFFLLGCVKQFLRGAESPDRNSLFDAMVLILTRLEKGTLNDVFLSWMDRLRSCVAAHGDDTE
jgi:hypothetical protein